MGDLTNLTNEEKETVKAKVTEANPDLPENTGISVGDKREPKVMKSESKETLPKTGENSSKRIIVVGIVVLLTSTFLLFGRKFRHTRTK